MNENKDEVLFCENCGARLSVESEFCDECGAQIEKSFSGVQQINGKTTGGNSVVFVVILLALAAVGSIIYVQYSKSGRPSEQVSVQGTPDTRAVSTVAISPSPIPTPTPISTLTPTPTLLTPMPTPTAVPEDTQDFEDIYGDVGEDVNEYEENEYILPESDSKYLTEQDIQGMSADEINLAKNELYARHGRIFQRKELQEYFENCSWYAPLYKAKEWDSYGDSFFFNKYEIKNRNFLNKWEKKRK